MQSPVFCSLTNATWSQGAGQAEALRRLEAAAAAAIGSSFDSADQGLGDQMMDDDDDESMEDGIDPDEEDDEELAMQQPTVHDVHVSTEPAEPAAASGRQRAAVPAR